MIACCVGCSPPPNSPCSARNSSSSTKLVQMPQASDATVNPAMEIRKYFFWPIRRLSEPLTVSTIPLATR